MRAWQLSLESRCVSDKPTSSEILSIERFKDLYRYLPALHTVLLLQLQLSRTRPIDAGSPRAFLALHHPVHLQHRLLVTMLRHTYGYKTLNVSQCLTERV